MPAAPNVSRIASRVKQAFVRSRRGRPVPHGVKPIEDIVVGDHVWSRTEDSELPVCRPVTRLFRRPRRQVIEVLYVTAARFHRLTATPEHPFWVEGRGWTAARALQAGDRLRTVEGHSIASVLAVEPSPFGFVDVFNFEVDADHNYHVGPAGILVHNSSSKPDARETDALRTIADNARMTRESVRLTHERLDAMQRIRQQADAAAESPGVAPDAAPESRPAPRSTPHFSFFGRGVDHMEFVQRQVASRTAGDLAYRILCAGCGTGEEPYGLAAELAASEPHPVPWRILAVDNSARTLAAARQAVYPAYRALDATPAMRRYLEPATSPAAGSLVVSRDLRQRVRFAQVDLLESAPPGPFDAIFMRNVLIHLPIAERRPVLERLHASLAPGGHLFLGDAEMLKGDAPFAGVQPGIYRRLP
jgi:chemotaxis methyl-accepting protein methylase